MFKKHPKGLAALFNIEMWERFGFYIMSAIYVLYMDQDLGFDDSTKGLLYGVFLLAAYTFPLLGGWLGDKVIGQVNTIRIGAWMMAIGYALLAISSKEFIEAFYAGLIMIAVGTGIFKVNMSVLIGNLYTKLESLRDAGFNIYYMGVNVGAAIGPTAAGILGAVSDGDYHWSFWAATIGMLIACVSIELGKKTLPDTRTLEKNETESDSSDLVEEVEMDKKEYWQRIVTLIVLFFIAALFWIPFYQNGFALTLFAERSTVAIDWLRPETYVAFNAYFILLLTPPLLILFSKLKSKNAEPSTPAKIFWGLLIMSFSMLIMVWASLAGGNDNASNMSPMWLITTYLFITLAEIMISPMGQSYVVKVAPPKIRGIMMGGWFTSTALGAFSAGIFGQLYSDLDHHYYYLVLASITFVSAILALVFMKKLKRFAK